jgi:hypothetical protein
MVRFSLDRFRIAHIDRAHFYAERWRPSTKPASPSPRRKPLSVGEFAVDVPRNPTSGIFGCCAYAASGHTAAPPRNVMKSRCFH